MDLRLSDLPGILGVKEADIDVIRTGGPLVTEDVLSELAVSTRGFGDDADHAAEREAECFNRRCLAGSNALLLL
jgi:hypothetical protein